MKRKTVGIIVALLVLAVVGGTAWSLRDLPQKRLLRAAENVVFADADSAAALLARVDTTRLTASSLMLYDLLRAMVYEERWYLRHADTTVCLTSDAETWNFNRQSDDRKSDDALTPDDSSRLRMFHYYKELSLGGTTDDEDALRRFGRACFVLSRRQNDSIVPMQVNQLFHLAIHCAETTGDHALAYRAYDKYFNRLPFHNTAYPEFYLHRALEHYRLSPDQPRWLLTMLNDYGYTVLLRAPFDLHHFGTLEHAAALAARQLDAPPSPAVTDAVYQCLDSLWALPHDDFSYMCSLRASKSTFLFGEVTVPVGMYEEVQQEHHEDGAKHWRPSYESETKKEEQNFAVTSASGSPIIWMQRKNQNEITLKIVNSTRVILEAAAMRPPELSFKRFYHHCGRSAFEPSLLAQGCDVLVEIGAAAVFSRQFVVEATAQVADVGLGGDEEDGHLERAALDDDETDDMVFLLGQRLVGLVLGVLLLQRGEKLGVLTINLVAECLPVLGRGVSVLR